MSRTPLLRGWKSRMGENVWKIFTSRIYKGLLHINFFKDWNQFFKMNKKFEHSTKGEGQRICHSHIQLVLLCCWHPKIVCLWNINGLCDYTKTQCPLNIISFRLMMFWCHGHVNLQNLKDAAAGNTRWFHTYL